MPTAWLGLGTNLGDKKKNLDDAIAEIGKLGEVCMVSSIYKSEAWGYQSKNAFYNLCIEISTSLKPEVVLLGLKEIEKNMGRSKQSEGYSDRIIDIDILLYNDLSLDQGDLTIPHPHMHERNFVLVPLNEIAPQLVHPILKKTIQELKEECEDAVQVSIVLV